MYIYTVYFSFLLLTFKCIPGAGGICKHQVGNPWPILTSEIPRINSSAPSYSLQTFYTETENGQCKPLLSQIKPISTAIDRPIRFLKYSRNITKRSTSAV